MLYVPILKWKRGERTAIQQLTGEIKDKIRPLFVILPDKEADTFIAEVIKVWGRDRPFYMDFHPNFLEDDLAINDFLKSLFEEMEGSKIQFIPVLSSVRDNNYIQIIKDNISLVTNGIALRVYADDLDTFKKTVESLANTTEIENDCIDVIIDLAHLTFPDGVLKALQGIVNRLIAEVKPLGFRSITVSGWSFPETLSGFTKNQITPLLRREWILWKEINKNHPEVVFGDYGVDDPYDVIPDQRVTIIPTIRYTQGDFWQIVRGERNPKAPYDYSQFHFLCKLLITEKAIYCGEHFSWADKYINDCACKICSGTGCNHGNLETWVKIATNHHLTYVISQLSNPF